MKKTKKLKFPKIRLPKNKYLRALLILVPVMIVLSFFALGGTEEQPTPRIPNPVVSVLDLSERPRYQVTEVGQIKALQEIELIAKATGTIGKLSVNVGEDVIPDQVIAAIDFDESDNPAQVNFDNAQLQLNNAQTNYSRTQANNQDSITRSSLRLQTLETTLGRLQRNLQELQNTNSSTKTTLELQVENAEKNEDTAQVNLDNLEAQFEESWDDLLVSTKTSLDSVFVSLESNFATIEAIINPSKLTSFNPNDMTYGLGVANSGVKNDVAISYGNLRTSLPAAKSSYLSYVPLTDTNTSFAIAQVKNITDDMRLFASKTRDMLNASIETNQLTAATLTAHKTSVATVESTILTNISTLNGLDEALSGFKLDRISQIATAENNLIISSNQLADANNALINFNTTGRGSIQDLETQITTTQNDILSAQADLASAQRSAGIANSSSNLELNTLQNQLRLAEKSLTDNKVKSSIDGVLSEFVVDEGDYVTMGTYLGKVIQHEDVKVVFFVSKENAERLSLGQEFTFSTAERSDREFTGIVSKIAPAADPINKKIRIEGSIENEDFFLKPEMYINLSLDLSAETFDLSKIYAPMNSIIFGQNDQYVYVIENQEVATRRSIEVGNIYGAWVEVTSGLNKDDLLIIEGQRNLPPAGGISVNIVE